MGNTSNGSPREALSIDFGDDTMLTEALEALEATDLGDIFLAIPMRQECLLPAEASSWYFLTTSSLLFLPCFLATCCRTALRVTESALFLGPRTAMNWKSDMTASQNRMTAVVTAADCELMHIVCTHLDCRLGFYHGLAIKDSYADVRKTVGG